VLHPRPPCTISLSLKHPPAFFRADAKLEPPPFFLDVVPLHRCLSCSGEPAVGFASSPSSSPALAGELRGLTAPNASCTGDAQLRYCPCHPLGPPWTRVHYRSTAEWTRSMGFSVEEIFGNSINPVNLTPSHLNLSHISPRSSDVCKNSSRALSF
jgi:hypothetical protein